MPHRQRTPPFVRQHEPGAEQTTTDAGKRGSLPCTSIVSHPVNGPQTQTIPALSLVLDAATAAIDAWTEIGENARADKVRRWRANLECLIPGGA